MNKKELLRDKAYVFFAPLVHALGRDRIEDKAHGYMLGYEQAIKDVQVILNEVGDLGDGDYIKNAIDALPGES